MVRSARRESESRIYHVMARGSGRCIVFEDDRDRLHFLDALFELCGEHQVELHAWCLMDNHYHLLVCADLDCLAKVMRRLNSAYAAYFNKRHERLGHLFQGRFKSEPVDDDSYYLTVLRYIHQNPEKAGICRTCDYPWSSYGEYLDGGDKVRTDFGLSMLGGIEEFTRFHATIDYAAPCLEIGSGRRIVEDGEAMAIARMALPDAHVESIASLDRLQRDEALRKLKDTSLSLRQIERLTGVSKSIVAKA